MFDSLLSKIHVLKLQKSEPQNFLDFTFSKILVLVKPRGFKYLHCTYRLNVIEHQ